eukprot:UN24944
MFNKMFQNVIGALKKRGYLPERKIYLEKGKLSKNYNVEELAGIATRHGAVIVDSKQKATHIVQPDQYFEDADEDYLRTLVVDRDRDVAFVHWWYYPSSYDEWVPLKMVQGDPEPKRDGQTVWEVGARWLKDTDKFNEWIPELDYEIEEDYVDDGTVPKIQVNVQTKQPQVVKQEQEMVSRAATQQTQQKKPNPQNDAFLFDDDEITDDDDHFIPQQTKPAPKKRQKKSPNRKRSRNNKDDAKQQVKRVRTEAKPQQQQQHAEHNYGQEMPTEVAPGVIDLQPSTGQDFDVPYTGSVLTKVQVQRPLYPVVVPSYANWFNQGMVHRIEWEEFRDLLQGDSAQNTEMYVRVRDTIVNTFRLNPRVYLSCTACRRLVTADAGLCFRIHKFLEKWNLINYYVDPGTIPSNTTQNIKHTHIETTDGIETVNNTNNLNPKSSSPTSSNNKPKRAELDLISANSFVSSNSCSFCGNNLGSTFYTSKTDSEVFACAGCHAKNNLTSLTQDDFKETTSDGKKTTNGDTDVTMTDGSNNNSENNEKNGWQPSHTDRLLEALNIYNDDWNEIANHTGRSVEECVKHF